MKPVQVFEPKGSLVSRSPAAGKGVVLRGIFALQLCFAAAAIGQGCSPDDPSPSADDGGAGSGGESGDAGAGDTTPGGMGGAGDINGGSAAGQGSGGAPPPSARDSATAVVGPAGGGLELEGASVVIPAGALAEAVTVTLRKLSVVPPGYELYSSAFALLPRDLEVAKPVTITLQFVGKPELATAFCFAPGRCGLRLARHQQRRGRSER